MMMAANKAQTALMRANLSPFGGEWVALSGDKVIAHGHDLKSVYASLKGFPQIGKLLFARVPGQETMIL